MVRVAPVAINGVVTYTAVLALDNSELLLRPGMTATADIVISEVKNALLIPNAALRYTPPAKAQAGSGRSNGLLGFLLPHRRASEVAKLAEPASGERTIYALEDGQPKRLTGPRRRDRRKLGPSCSTVRSMAGTTVITGSSATK